MRIQIRKTDAAVADFWGDGAELRGKSSVYSLKIFNIEQTQFH
jgi:hypothetical protein